MNVFLWLFCLMLFCAPMTQVARKDVGDMKLRQQMRDWRALSRARARNATAAAHPPPQNPN